MDFIFQPPTEAHPEATGPYPTEELERLRAENAKLQQKLQQQHQGTRQKLRDVSEKNRFLRNALEEKSMAVAGLGYPSDGSELDWTGAATPPAQQQQTPQVQHTGAQAEPMVTVSKSDLQKMIQEEAKKAFPGFLDEAQEQVRKQQQHVVSLGQKFQSEHPELAQKYGDVAAQMWNNELAVDPKVNPDAAFNRIVANVKTMDEKGVVPGGNNPMSMRRREGGQPQQQQRGFNNQYPQNNNARSNQSLGYDRPEDEKYWANGEEDDPDSDMHQKERQERLDKMEKSFNMND